MPPEGTVPVNPGEAPHDPADEAAANAIQNPRPLSLASLENGRVHVRALLRRLPRQERLWATVRSR